jgi:hypothetical protein
MQALDKLDINRAAMICQTFAAYCSSNIGGLSSKIQQVSVRDACCCSCCSFQDVDCMHIGSHFLACIIKL